MIFNVVVEAVIRKLVILLGFPQEGTGQEGTRQEGLETSIQTLLTLFYTNDGIVVLLESARLQGVFDALTRLSEQVGLLKNKGNMESEVYQPCKPPRAW